MRNRLARWYSSNFELEVEICLLKRVKSSASSKPGAIQPVRCGAQVLMPKCSGLGFIHEALKLALAALGLNPLVFGAWVYPRQGLVRANKKS